MMNDEHHTTVYYCIYQYVLIYGIYMCTVKHNKISCMCRRPLLRDVFIYAARLQCAA